MTARGALLALAAFAALSFSNGSHAHPLFAWIGPLLLLRLVRTAPGWRVVGFAWLVFLAAWLVGWSGVFRLGLAGLAPTAVFLSLVGFAPYALDRLIAQRLPPLAATLVLPAANVAVEAGLALVSPFGAWGAIGYSQVELLPLAQLAALTGTYGLGFLPLWFAAVANGFWDRPAERSHWRPAAIAFAAVIGAATGFGLVRLAAPGPVPVLPAAMLTPSIQDNLNYDERLAGRIGGQLFAQAEAAAAAGARLVVGPEDSLFLRGTAAEQALLARMRALAVRRSLYFGLAYGLRTGATGLAYRNRFVLIAPDGRLAWRYDKAWPVPGYEAHNMRPGVLPIARADTAFGTVAGAICFDGDHAPVLRAASGSALLILPSDDWPAIRTLHARMARLRALEIGVPLLRPAINGIMVATDGRGRRLAWRDSRSAGSRIVPVGLPLDAEATFQSRNPGLFPAGSALLLCLLLGWALLRGGAYASPAPSPSSSPEPWASAK